MSSLKLVVGASGVFISYLINSVFLEKIFTHKYPSNSSKNKTEDHFEHSDLVQLITASFCLLYALISMIVKK